MLDNIYKFQSERNLGKVLKKLLELDNRNSENFYQNSMTIVTNKNAYDEIEKSKLKLYTPNIVKH